MKRHSKQLGARKKFRYVAEFTDQDWILLVGEGNFTFSRALAEKIHGAFQMICTCFDSETELHEKYPDCVPVLQDIEELGGSVLFNVDATKLSGKALKRRFSKIVFNFPHVGRSIKDQDRNILANQQLLSAFFHASIDKLTSLARGDEFEGQILVTLKSGDPYDKWNIKSLAAKCGLKCIRSFEFSPDDYPGYYHCRTSGSKIHDNSEISNKMPRTFIFSRSGTALSD
jgi:25S rRNA (uracil2634-N3)-methyltransferase